MSQPLERLFAQAADACACFKDVCGFINSGQERNNCNEKKQKSYIFYDLFCHGGIGFYRRHFREPLNN